MTPHELGQLYRRRGAALHAALTRLLGSRRLDLVENVVQDAFEAALRQWPTQGTPENPEGWLLRVARNRALDRLRHETTAGRLEPAVMAHLDAVQEVPTATLGWELPDDELTMMFVSCHPSLPDTSRVVLTLQALGGLTRDEIAAALLTSPETVKKRLQRARALLAADPIPFALPGKDALDERLDDVLRVLWLLFAEGYAAHRGQAPIRAELCAEALRLIAILATHPGTRRPKVSAVRALMALQAARIPARIDEHGRIVRLADQDRSRWNRALISEGLLALGDAIGGPLTPYHLEAGIAACHVMAARFEDTDWHRITAYYDQLLALSPSPVIAVNRAIAVAFARGPEAGLDALDAVDPDGRLSQWAVLPAASAEMLAELGETERARSAFREAIARAPTDAEREHLEHRLASLER